MRPFSPRAREANARLAWTDDLPGFSIRDFGAKGNGSADDTPAIASAFTEIAARRLLFTPTSGAGVVTVPSIRVPVGRYMLTDDLVPPSSCRIIAEEGAVFEQTTAGQRILNFSDCYDVSIRGLKFVAGTNQIYLQNENTNYTRLRIADCEFQTSTDYAIYTKASISSSSAAGTGTIDVTNGQTAVAGAGTAFTGFLKGSKILVGSVEGVVASVTNDTSLTLESAWTGSTLTGQSFKYVDGHMSALLRIEDCAFYNPRKVLYNATDEAFVMRSWVSVGKDNFDASTAAFLNHYGNLRFDGMMGVPSMGTGGARLANVRWVDNYQGSFYARNSRFGGEDSGMGIVYNFSKYTDVSPFNSGATISIVDCDVSAGESGVGGSGVIHIGSEAPVLTTAAIPQQIIYTGNKILSDNPIITNTGGNSIATKLATIDNPQKKIKYLIHPNQVWGETEAPAELNRFIHYGGPTAPNTSFTFEIVNTAGTLQHRIFAHPFSAAALGNYAFMVNGASATLSNTPTVGAGTPFTAGAGISVSANAMLFDVPDQEDINEFPGIANINFNETGTDVTCFAALRSLDVNGVTAIRLTIAFNKVSDGSAFDLTTANIAASKRLRVHFLGRLK